jgi:hypothetical protein
MEAYKLIINPNDQLMCFNKVYKPKVRNLKQLKANPFGKEAVLEQTCLIKINFSVGPSSVTSGSQPGLLGM